MKAASEFCVSLLTRAFTWAGAEAAPSLRCLIGKATGCICASAEHGVASFLGSSCALSQSRRPYRRRPRRGKRGELAARRRRQQPASSSMGGRARRISAALSALTAAASRLGAMARANSSRPMHSRAAEAAPSWAGWLEAIAPGAALLCRLTTSPL